MKLRFTIITYAMLLLGPHSGAGPNGDAEARARIEENSTPSPVLDHGG